MCLGYIKGLEQCLALAEYYVLLHVFKNNKNNSSSSGHV